MCVHRNARRGRGQWRIIDNRPVCASASFTPVLQAGRCPVEAQGHRSALLALLSQDLASTVEPHFQASVLAHLQLAMLASTASGSRAPGRLRWTCGPIALRTADGSSMQRVEEYGCRFIHI